MAEAKLRPRSKPKPKLVTYPCCASCAFYEEIKGQGEGVCRRFPPHGRIWAVPQANDWCNEHRRGGDDCDGNHAGEPCPDPECWLR